MVEQRDLAKGEEIASRHNCSEETKLKTLCEERNLVMKRNGVSYGGGEVR